MTNFLSRINSPDDIILISYNFPYENLFVVTAKTPWFADIENYLSSGILSSHFTSKQKMKIIKQSARYIWVNGDLFYTNPDLLIKDA